MQKLGLNKKKFLWILLGVGVFLVALQFFSTTEYITIPNKENYQEIPDQDRILLLAPIYMAFADFYPEFDKYTQEKIQPVCPLYVPDVQTYRDCIERETKTKIIMGEIPEDKLRLAQSDCDSMTVIFNIETESGYQEKMLDDSYFACILYKLDNETPSFVRP